jgi:hypothetical protein
MEGLELDLDFVPAEDDNTEVVETPVDDNAEVVETPLDTPAEPTEEEQEPTDGRKVPDDVRKALKALRDSSPENAKAARALNDVYGREQAYKQVFASVKDAQAAQSTIQTIESFGGLEAVQTTVAEIEEIDQLLQAGDFKAIDKLVEVSGEGFSKIAPEMLNRLQSSNPDAYAAAIRPHLVDAIGKSGLSDAFGAVIQALDLANTPGATAEFKGKFEGQAKEGLSKIYQYLQNLGKQAPVTAPVQDTGKFTEREQALASREAAAFNTEVASLANGKMNTSLSKAVAPYVGKFTPDQRKDFTQSVYDEIGKLVKADKVYQGQKDSLFKSKTKDAGKIATLMGAKFDAVVGQAAKNVYSRRYGTTAPAAAKSATQGQPATAVAAGKPTLVNELPNRNDVDWSKTDEDMMIRGIRVLKNGKTVKLNR